MWVALACVAAATTGTPAERAFAHQEAAFAHLRANRHCEAAAELEAAYALDGQPGHLLNRALAIALWPGHCAEAVAAYDRYLATAPTGPEAAEARGKRAEILDACPAAQPVAVVTEAPPATTEAPPIKAAPWIAGGVALVGAAAGAGFLALALDDRDDIERWQARGLREMTEQYRGREESARDAFARDQALAWVGFGLAGAALSTAVTLWLWPEP